MDSLFNEYINDAWDVVPRARPSGNTVSFTIVDNGPYDADSTTSGISDQCGPDWRNGGGGGGPAPIPVLSGARLLTMLAGLLGLGGFYARRPR